MPLDQLELIKVIPDYLQAFAVIGAGLFAYYKFIRYRQKEPATNIDVDLRFVGKQDKKGIIEITCILENKSLFRHTYTDFQVTVRYFLPEDKLEDGPAMINYQLQCPRTIDERLINRTGETPAPMRVFSGADLTAKDENQNYIHPNQIFNQRYITWIPENATFVWVQCKFFYKIGSKRTQKTNTQKIFKVP